MGDTIMAAYFLRAVKETFPESHLDVIIAKGLTDLLAFMPYVDSYHKYSPHKFVQNWDTPILVIHGEKDFRVPVNQGMEAFNAAKLQGIPARFLYYPTEGHWVQSPQNGVLWHRVFFEWLARDLK